MPSVAGSPYSGNIVLSSAGASPVNVPTVASTVSTAALTITGLTGANKVYNGNTDATFTGTAAYNGLQNGEMHSVTGTPVATFASPNVGMGITINVTGYTAPNTNYTLTQPTLVSKHHSKTTDHHRHHRQIIKYTTEIILQLFRVQRLWTA
jgi:hypothetical protein